VRSRALPVRLQHGELHVGEVADLLQSRLGLELPERQSLPAHVALDDLAARDQDDRLAVEQPAQRRRAEAQVRRPDDEHDQRRQHDQRPRQRVVGLGDPLLDEVADDHELVDVERLHGAELATTDRARHDEDEDEDDDGAQNQVHDGSPQG